MSNAVWPEFQAGADLTVGLLRDFFLDKTNLGYFFRIAVLVSIYFIGIFTPIPFLSETPKDLTDRWWFFSLMDEVFTGGAWGRQGIFCLGIFASIAWDGYSLSPKEGVSKKSLLKGVISCLLLVCLTAAMLLMKHETLLGVTGTIKILAFISFGCVGVIVINKLLIKYKGPQIIHLNIFLLLMVHFITLSRMLFSGGHYIDLTVMAAGVLLVISAALYLLCNTFQLEVKNVKNHLSRRFTTIQFKGLDEISFEILSNIGLLLFICLAGILSILFGYRALSGNHFIFIATISLISSIAMIWCIHITKVVFSSHRSIISQMTKTLINRFGLLLGDAHHYAQQLLNYYWIIPNIPAGHNTKSFLETRLRKNLNRALMMFVVCLLGLLLFQGYSSYYGAGKMLYPYGPLVFILLILMSISNISIVFSEIHTKLFKLKQIKRGKYRILQQAYALQRPKRVGSIDFSEGSFNYYDDDRLASDLGDMIEWYRTMRDLAIHFEKKDVKFPKKEGSLRNKLYIFLTKVAVGFITGTLFAFVGGVLFLLFVPDGEGIWAVIISLFVPGFFSPNFLHAWIGKSRR